MLYYELDERLTSSSESDHEYIQEDIFTDGRHTEIFAPSEMDKCMINLP